MECGTLAELKDMELLLMQIRMSIQVTGSRTELKGTECKEILMVVSMKALGTGISKMELVKRFFQMNLALKETLFKVKNWVLAFINGLMALPMRVNGMITKLKVSASIHGSREKPTQAFGKTV